MCEFFKLSEKGEIDIKMKAALKELGRNELPGISKVLIELI